MPAGYTSPISSPPFFYSPRRGFYVIIDDVKYSRAGTDKLHHFLTYKDPGPVLNKAGKPGKYQPSPRPDQPTQFYMAQLQLYGLEPASSKEAAKKTLLGAIEGPGGLVTSEEVLTIQIGLAKEWNNTAEAELKEKVRLRKEMKAERTYKRHRDEDELVTKFEAPSSKKSKSEKGSKRHANKELSASNEATAPKVSEGSEVNDSFPLQHASSSTGEHVGNHEGEEGEKCDAGNGKGSEE